MTISAGLGGNAGAGTSPFSTGVVGITMSRDTASSSSSQIMESNQQPSLFGSQPSLAPSLFGSVPSSKTPFGSPMSSPPPAPAFGSSPSPFGTLNSSINSSAPAFGSSGSSMNTFAGKSPREMLVSFYQQHKPEKIAEVDKLLNKYMGREDELFRNLAKKYNMDPALFGLSSQPPAPAGFGSPSTVGFGTSPGFGQPSQLGGGPSPFGGSSGGGFGQPSPLGFSSPGSGIGGGSTFGQATGGFGGATSFGALAQGTTQSPFGSPSFGGPAGGGMPFGSATPFGAPRR